MIERADVPPLIRSDRFARNVAGISVRDFRNTNVLEMERILRGLQSGLHHFQRARQDRAGRTGHAVKCENEISVAPFRANTGKLPQSATDL